MPAPENTEQKKPRHKNNSTGSARVVKHGLNAKQIRFCEFYVSKEFFANGVEAYGEAYNVDITGKGYFHAKSNACKLLTNAYILKYINQLFDGAGLNDEFVDKQLLLTITQNADLGSKVAAVREYNKLKARITDKLDLTTKGKQISSGVKELSFEQAYELKYGKKPTGSRD